MRRYIKKQLYGILETMLQAHKDTLNRAQKRNLEAALGLLAECQNAALHIGNTIEESEGKNLEVITLLEGYCDLLYQASLALPAYGTVWHERLDKQLSDIRSKISNSIRETREIAFLPYKASMWDCLESIWLAAEEDADSECFVVPIPYFDKEADGTLGKMHCEADLFPDYVPVTSWETYNIAERKPDIIYIHNPYDSDNHVTTIHPVFYSKELKKHTDMLVYIPYFVGMDDVPENLCISAGTVYSDRVIVQSEAVRNTYIREYNKFLKDNHAEGVFVKAEDKFIALGSPKIDRILHTTRDNVEVSKEWKEKIGEKKVVLYNTSIKELLMESENYIKKLGYVLDCFEKYRDTVVLLWRPHPLSDDTYKALRPQLLEKYKKIIGEYKAEGWGIYDDSPDVHRAIAISDAYYGDFSSLVPMYGITGKPIMIQNVYLNKNPGEEKFLPLWMDDILVDRGYAWFSASNYNGLYRLDLKEHTTKLIGKFPNEDEKQARLYGNITRYEDRLIFTPLNADEIAIFNISSQKFKKYPIACPIIDNDRYCGNYKFFATIVHNKCVFFIGACFPAIIRLNLETDEIKYYTQGFDELLKLYSSNSKTIHFRKDYVVNGHTLLLPSRNTNIVMEFDLDNYYYKFHRVGEEGSSYSGICYDGNCYWLSHINRRSLVKWNKETNEWKAIINSAENNDNENMYSSLIFIDGKVWTFSETNEQVYNIDVMTEKFSRVSLFDELAEMPVYTKFCRYRTYPFLCLRDNIVYTYSTLHNRFIIYNTETGELMTFPVVMQSADRMEYQLEALYSGTSAVYFFSERTNAHLAYYMDSIAGNELKSDSARSDEYKKLFNCNGDCGSRINGYISKI